MAKKKDQATSDGMKEAIQLLMSKNEELKDQLRKDLRIEAQV